MNSKEKKLINLIGKRILSEANDLKRTIPSISSDLGISEEQINMIIEGKSSFKQALDLIHNFSKTYPVKVSDLLLDYDDTDDSVIIMKSKDSAESSRIYERKNSKQELSPYYDYRDTAISKFSPFRPEWIRELRVVEDSNPNNPDVAYNNGHLMHQMTAFIGPVNFYWELNGIKYCKEMKTGDSNFITPFWKHSFTSRDESEDAIIIAVTFSGDVGRARNELFSLGQKSIEKFTFDNKNVNKAISQLMRQLLNDNLMSIKSFQDDLTRNNINVNVEQLIDPIIEKDKSDLEKIAKFLSLPRDIFDLPYFDPKTEVITEEYSSQNTYFYK